MNRAVLILSFFITSTAFADEPAYPPPLLPPSSVEPAVPTYVPVPMQALPLFDPENGPKNSGTAIALSLAGTVAPSLIASVAYGDHDHDEEMLWILGTSALFGPSLGQWYAGKVITPGLGVRALGFALGAAAFGADDLDTAVGLLLISSTCILGGAIHDVATAPRSVREYNFAYATRMTPMIAPSVGADGRTQLKLGLAGSW